MELTRREGPRRAAASQGIANRNSECTAGANGLVHTPRRDRKRFTRSDLLGPSALSLRAALPHVHANDGQRTRFRSPCSRCTPLLSEPRLLASGYASDHVLMMLTCV